ncbi:MAG: hypothetical protein WC865_03700 [Bacteroidales bacterium]
MDTTDLKKLKINNTWHFNEITSQTGKMIGKLGIPMEEYNT